MNKETIMKLRKRDIKRLKYDRKKLVDAYNLCKHKFGVAHIITKYRQTKIEQFDRTYGKLD